MPPMSCTEQIEIEVVLIDSKPMRLDVYLSRQLPNFTRSRIQKLIDSGMVTAEGEKVKSGLKLHGGEKLTVRVPENRVLAIKAQEIPLDILFEDNHLAVINKPAGMVTHPGAGVSEGTLVNALLHHCQGSLSGISGVVRPGIVHRLDKDTSGLIVVAKEDKTHQSLSEQIRHKTAKRIYIALLEGTLKEDSGLVDKPIGRNPLHRKKMAIVNSGRTAVSHYEVIRRWAQYTLVRVSLTTGRTHQIRVHMLSLGCPVVGDIVYNNKNTGTLAKRHRLGLIGHALHASQLSFTHPTTGVLLEFQAPLPADFQRLLDAF